MKNDKKILTLCHTWGIIMTLIGYAARIVLRCAGIKGTQFGFVKVYNVGKGWGGISLGTTVIVSDDCFDKETIAHETGHSIQNAMYGVLFPFIVAIPSFIRSRYYVRLMNKGITPERDYYSIWFESQATKLGWEYFRGYKRYERKT